MIGKDKSDETQYVTLPLEFTPLTPRCRLRCVSEADIPHVFSATRYEGFNDGMVWDAPATMEALQEPLRKNLEAWAAGTGFCFTIESRQGRIFLGRVSIKKVEGDGVWSIGFWTHPQHQGQGYMSEAAKAIVDFGFGHLAAQRIEACHAVWNRKSERILKKVGMTFVKHNPEGFRKKGQWVEENLLAVQRGDWAAQQAVANRSAETKRQ